MTAKGLACALLTNRKLVREVDKALLGDRYGEMLPTPSQRTHLRRRVLPAQGTPVCDGGA